jgi:hypothetical protein
MFVKSGIFAQKRNFLRYTATVGFALTFTSFGASASASCLDQAAAFSERICGEISRGGTSNLVSGSGELTVKAKGIIARMFGVAGGNAKVDAVTSSYQNVVREELAKELKDTRACKERMVSVAIQQQICNKQAVMKTVCTGEFENNCPGPSHDIFYTCGYFGSDKQIAENICEGIKEGHVRLKTVGGNKCGYALIEVTCKPDL